MKKLIYLLLLIVPLLTFGQKDKRENENEKTFFKEKDKLFKGYAVAGLNFNQIDGDISAGYNIVGANAGGGVFITYSKHFSNSLEISYSMRGAKSVLNFKKTHPQFFYYQLDYIEVPLMFNYHDFKIAIFQIGLSFTQLIREDYQGTSTPNIDQIYGQNIDMVFGTTFLFKKHWGLNFKFNYSILNNLKRYKSNGDLLARGNLISQPAKTGVNANPAQPILNWYHNVLTLRAMYVF